MWDQFLTGIRLSLSHSLSLPLSTRQIAPRPCSNRRLDPMVERTLSLGFGEKGGRLAETPEPQYP